MTWGPGDIVAGKYRIDSLLGSGGMGTVYAATNEKLWKKVALKVLASGTSPEAAERFTREAIAASSVKHPGVVEIYDADVHEGTPWIAMELLEGETLGERIARGPLAPGAAAGIAADALEALAAVHAAGIVHRDLKPDNLFLERTVGGGERVKILDFGIAKILEPGALGSSTKTGIGMGTPFFLAPEQATESKSVDARADLYGIGAILFYALSGELPYASQTFGELVRQMYTEGPRSLRDVSPHTPPALIGVVDRCLRVEPGERPASAAELAEALEAAMSGAPVSSVPKTMALDAEELKRGIAPTGAAPAAGGWHPQPQAAPVAGATTAPAGGFGSPPRGPAPTAAPAAKPSSGAGPVLLVLAVVGGLGALGLALVVIVGAAAGVWFAARSEPPPLEQYPEPLPAPAPLTGAGSDEERIRIEVSDAMPQRGPDDALVTIVTFSDYQCPFCARVNPTVERILREHPNDVRLVWRDHPLPFHQEATPAAETAREAYAQGGDAMFWRMHTLLFENQRALDRASLERYATQIGMDVNRLRIALDAQTHRAAIERDSAASTTAGARGTPAFFLNGRKLMGAQPYERFDSIVREEIAIANQLVAGGTPRSRVYEQLMRDAVVSPAPEDPSPRPSTRPQPDPNAIYRVPVGASPQLGRADALVTIVVFSEFQCPFCNRVRPTLDQIRERYGNDVRLVFKHNPLPFHPNAMPAAMAAIEVQEQRGDEAFWRFHDVLFENQRELTRENLERWARAEGVSSVGAAIDGERHARRIEQEQTLARSLGATGTPSFFINGRNLRGAQPFPAFQTVIDEELARARAELLRGTPRGSVYEALIRDGATSPQTLAGAAPAPAAAPAGDHYRIAPAPRAPSRGPASAPVTIEVFSDFQCPFCSRLGPTLEQIERRYPTQVRIVWRNYPLPFHNNAMGAAEAALEVHAQGGDTAFWRYHDLLFENQRELDRANLERFAQQLGGIDMARFRRALDQRTHRAAIEADMSAVRDAGARIGTPSSFINGRLLQGAQPLPAFESAIQAELGR